MLAIFKRELKSCFSGMLGYLLTAFMVLVIGIYFVAQNLGYGVPDFGYYTLYRTMFVLLIYVPVLAMRSLAEERHSRTEQLLLSSPVSVAGIVLGKFFAMCVVFLLPCLVYVLMILALWAAGASAAATVCSLSCLLCYYVLGCAGIAVCEFISGLTENALLAAVGGFVVLLLAYLMPGIESLYSTGSLLGLIFFVILLVAAAVVAGLFARSLAWGCGVFCGGCAVLVLLFWLRGSWLTAAFSWVMDQLSLFTPFEDFINQSFSIPALVYYISVAALFLFCSCQALEKRRWN